MPTYDGAGWLFGAIGTAWLVSDALARSLARLHRQQREGSSEPWLALAGGLALAFSFTAAFSVFRPPTLDPLPYAGLLLTSIGVFLAGLADETRWLRWGLWPVVLLAGWLLSLVFGVTVEVVKLPFTHRFVELGRWAAPLTGLWIGLVTYAVASTNRIPGLTAGIGALAAATFGGIAGWKGGPGSEVALALAAPLLGSSLGFLRYGLSPTPLGIGRGGAAFLGFLLGAVTVAGTLKNTAFLVILLPMLVLGMPLIDATYARVLGRRGARRVEVASRSLYLHDALLEQGFSERQAALLLLALHAYFCLMALLMVGLITLHFALKLLLLLFLVPLGLGVFWLVSRIAAQAVLKEPLPQRVPLLDVGISPVTMETTLQRVREFIAEGGPHLIVTSNATALIQAQEDPELRSIINQADLVTPDGAGVLWSAKVLGLPLLERVSGIDLMQELCRLAAQEGYRVFLLGAAPGVAEEAARRLQERFPGLQVAGTHHGYFGPEEEEEVLERIREAQPDILFVAFGIPKQEKWIWRHRERLQVPVCLGVGGSFDVLSGRIPRAPLWMQRWGLEWLWRVWKEPRRLPRLAALPRFVWEVTRWGWQRGRQGP